MALEVTFTVSGWVNGVNDEPVQGAVRLMFGALDPTSGTRTLLSGSLVTGVGGPLTTLSPGFGSLTRVNGWQQFAVGAQNANDSPYIGLFVEVDGRLQGGGVRWGGTGSDFTLDGQVRAVPLPGR